MFCIRRNIFLKYSALSICLFSNAALPVEFNIDVLDSADKENIDFSRFSNAGYILPGKYQLRVMVNGQSISPSAMDVSFYERKDSAKEKDKKEQIPQACLTPDMVNKMGLTESSLEKVFWWNSEECADFRQLPGVDIRPDLSVGVLHINMPQAWLEYSDATWLPPSRWDNGIPGLLFDYNINASVNDSADGQKTQYLSFYGTTGANFGAWRLRADYQGNLNNGEDDEVQSDFSWSRFYMYRAIPRWKSKLTLGENYITSDIFSSWRYTGVSLESDDRMLPPKLRGYAPQVSGVADTNARVVISQQGRIIYDSTVPAGPFTIQDLDGSIRGRLDVEIIEQNGQKKRFQVDTAYVPYLTRPGQVRYKLVGGRPLSEEDDETEGPSFVSGEASWGINNDWSLYGGATLAGDYNALAVGLGRDLKQLGTLSVDVTGAVSKFDDGTTDTMRGKSWRVSYSKRFDEADADITFAGYRFSEHDYMTMQQYLDARYRNDFSGREKELYTITLNKNLEGSNTSINFQYSYQTYWDMEADNYYTLSVNRYFDAFGFKNISLGLTASRSEYEGRDNDSLFVRLSIPWGTGTANYNGNVNDGRLTQTAGYSDTLNNGLDNYSINAGLSTGGDERSAGQFSGYYSHSSPLADISVNMATEQNNYTSFGMTVSGGATITAKGAALHAGGMNGGTRMMVDTDGVGGVPVDGGRVSTNRWGIGVVTDMSSYYRNTTSVDLKKLPEDMEATHSVVESALTEGAIGYREFGILKGTRLFAVLRMADGKHPPFGASVTNEKGRELGMVSDEGLAWLTGVTPGEDLNVNWDAKAQCQVNIPQKITPEQQLLLPCK